MRSKFEERFAADLTKRGIAYEYEAQAFAYRIERKYNPDFKLKKKNGSVLWIETKGVLDVEDRRKLLAVIAQWPALDLRLVFQRASNKITKGSKTSYGDWATKQGIVWAEGRVPAAWLAE